MAEAVKNTVKAESPKIDEKAAKEAANATLLALAGAQKAAAVKAQSSVQAAPKEKAVQNVEAAPAASEATPAKAVTKAESTKTESKKEADPSKEFVDGIMTEMALKGVSKKRLIKKLAEQFNFDKQKVMFKLKRALITERYAAAHEAGH
jgi:hypothetical protein